MEETESLKYENTILSTKSFYWALLCYQFGQFFDCYIEKRSHVPWREIRISRDI